MSDISEASASVDGDDKPPDGVMIPPLSDYGGEPSVAVEAPVAPSPWYAIKGILNHRRRGCIDEYLVEQENSDEKTWVKRLDVSAFQ